MKRFTMLVTALLYVAWLGVAAAGEAQTVTIEGKVVCAKCALHEEGRTSCQNVLVVERAEDDADYYYLAKNEVNEEFGEVCMTKPVVRVTGTLEDKDGKRWITPSEIEPVEQQKG